MLHFDKIKEAHEKRKAGFMISKRTVEVAAYSETPAVKEAARSLLTGAFRTYGSVRRASVVI